MNRCALLAGFGVLASVDDSPDSSALEKNRRPRRVEAVWKRDFCVIAPCQRAQKRLGEPLPRYARLRG
jgi:hypothetical protein